MKIFYHTLALALSALSVLAVEVDDTYEQVIAEKGKPSSKLEMGDVLILSYPGQRIKLKNLKVSEVKEVKDSAATPPAAPSTPPAPQPRPPVVVAPPAATPPPSADASHWGTDYAAALVSARQRDVNVFLFFTGSDWCGWCTRLDTEILSTKEFKSYAAENLILVELDFPKNELQTSQLKAQNNQLASRYGVEGFPTIIVLNPAGRKIGELGYQRGGPQPFIAALRKL